ncbi:MAG: hypothetical protein K0U45_08170 [Alphaproteobacteria bacterium]|nr:hypothetical protein [Alphaproteobacteria bacterium]
MTINSILFCCDYNASRSAMAEGIIREWYEGKLKVASAGLSDDQLVNGYAVSAMAEMDIDISNHQAQLIKSLNDTPFDIVVSLTKSSNLEAQKLSWANNTIIEHWDIASPIDHNLSREQQLDNFRKTRDILMKLILARFPLPLTDDDSDYLHHYFEQME